MSRTPDGLPRVTEETFIKFLCNYEFDISSAKNDPRVTCRIQKENPQIHRILDIGMKNAPNREASVYYELGIQICYELLRIESKERNL